MHRAGPMLLAAIALAFGLVACDGDDEGGSDDGATTATTATAPAEGTTTTGEVEETVDEPAELPTGWSEEINRSAGFSIGVPPDWSIRRARGGQGSVLTSPDELTTIAVTVDRTRGALELPLDEFALRTTEALGSEVVGADRFEDLEVGEAAPFDHTYEAVGVRAIGRSKRTGVLERILVVVARRPEQAAYVFIARENAEEPPQQADRDTIKEIIRSLRGRPPA